MSKTPRYLDYDFVLLAQPIVSPKMNGTSDATFNGGKAVPNNSRSGFRFFREGDMFCVEWPPTGRVAETHISNVRQAMRYEPKATEEVASS